MRKLGQHVRLAQRARQARVGKDLQQLGLGVQRKQLGQGHVGIRIDPAQRQQGLRGGMHIGDLVVHQFVCAEPGPAPHQHAHHQRLRLHRGLRKVRQKLLLLRIQHIAIALPQPLQRALEVVQVVVAMGGQHGDGHDDC